MAREQTWEIQVAENGAWVTKRVTLAEYRAYVAAKSAEAKAIFAATRPGN